MSEPTRLEAARRLLLDDDTADAALAGLCALALACVAVVLLAATTLGVAHIAHAIAVLWGWA